MNPKCLLINLKRLLMNMKIINLKTLNLLMMKQKMYFNNNKSLIVYINYALLVFYLCQFRRYKHYGLNNRQNLFPGMETFLKS